MGFTYRDTEFSGINPSGKTFQYQTDTYSCWAACIVNARSALLDKSDVSDIDILEKTHPSESFTFKAIHDKEIHETIMLVSGDTGVTTVETEPIMLPGGSDLMATIVSKGIPAMLVLENPSDEVGHVVLVLGVNGGKLGLDTLIFDPWIPDEPKTKPGTMAHTMKLAKCGLKVLSYPTLVKHGKYFIPIVTNELAKKIKEKGK